MASALTPELVLQAYRSGLFPMAPHRNSKDIHWYDPDQRGVLPIKGMHVPERLRRTVRKGPYRITFDVCFERVMRECADVRPDTWINDGIIETYTALHRQGFAHSVEAWSGDHLAGGVYGLALGSAFFGESMFSTETNASKIALVYLVARLWRQGFTLLDTQFVNAHLLQFGVHEISRAEYHSRLREALVQQVFFRKDQSSKSVTGVSGAAAGAFSGENSSDFEDVLAFLQSMTQTS